MLAQVNHKLGLKGTRDERARQAFTSSLRGFVLHDLAGDMRRTYLEQVEPALEVKPDTPTAVHKAIRHTPIFKYYSSMRVNAQEMVWDSVRAVVDREGAKIDEAVARAGQEGLGTLTLDPGFQTPRNVTEVDVHLMPGNYHHETVEGDARIGALFDNGSAVFYMGLMGRDQSDIAESISRFIRLKYPDLAPATILDLGCTIGHNTLPWKTTFPEAEVHGIDVAAPSLRYAHARAQEYGVPVHWRQGTATDLSAFPDNSVDLVWSSMFWHEVPLKDIRKAFAEARRVLRPGGMMLTMELPPNNQMNAYDGFYLDWDAWYNSEPFYKTFRDQDPQALHVEAGFAPGSYFQHVVPSLNWFGEEAIRQAAEAEGGIDENTGRFDQGISWFCFGARK